MPLLKYRDIKEDDIKVNTKFLETTIIDGVRQQINLGIKNIGMNSIRRIYIQINSDILKMPYKFELENQSILEKGEEQIIQILLNLMVDSTYKFVVSIYYQDLLCNWYEQVVEMEYKVYPIKDGTKCLYENKLYVANEQIILEEDKIKEIQKEI